MVDLARIAAADSTILAPLPGSDFYYATLYVPREIRDALATLEAFRGELVRIPLTCSDRGVARVKLAWWREEIERLGNAQARHEITQALAPLIIDNPPLQRILEGAIAAVDSRFNHEDIHTSAEHLRLIDQIHGSLWGEYARICGAVDRETIDAVRTLGCWIEIGYGLRDFRKLIDADLVPIPLESLEKHGLNAHQLTTPINRESLSPLLKEEIDTARERISSAISAVPRGERRAQRVAMTLGHIIAATLSEVARDGYRVIDQRIELTPVRKLWTAWRIRISG